MLKILDKQLHALRAHALAQFVRNTVARVRRDHPLRTEPWSDAGLLEFVSEAASRGLRMGLVSERDLGTYVDLTLIYGKSFDASHPEVQRVLEDGALGTLDKVDAVYALLGAPPEPDDTTRA